MLYKKIGNSTAIRMCGIAVVMKWNKQISIWKFDWFVGINKNIVWMRKLIYIIFGYYLIELNS